MPPGTKNAAVLLVGRYCPQRAELGVSRHPARWRQTRPTLMSLCIVAALLCAYAARAGTNLVILPQEIRLSGPEARQELIVEQEWEKQFYGQCTNDVQFVPSDLAVVRIEKGVAVPIANGA